MRLTVKNIAKFTYYTYSIEELDVPGIKTIETLINHYKLCEKDDVPVLLDNKYVRAHYHAIEYVKKYKKRKPQIKDVMKLHEIIMFPFSSKLHMRTGPLMVGGRVAPGPGEIPEMFLAWLDTWGKSCYKSYSKKKTCFMRHCEFEYIHPFPKGNGVVGRLLYLWDCLYNNTKMDIIKERETYFASLDEYYYELRSRILPRWS